ncbi:MAG: ATPase [Mucilaginibacter sp.]|nr:ATPase [Mucilaginibacter sp.]
MQKQDYTTTFQVDQSPEQVFEAINNVRGWWSEQIDGPTDKLNAEFNYHYKDVHRCKLKITEFIPGKKVVWLVLENKFDFTKNKAEWTDTKISFDIVQKNGKTLLIFTHFGLVPAYECYQICSDAWGNYITGSLKSLIETGKGKPNPYIPAINNAEALKGGQHE